MQTIRRSVAGVLVLTMLLSAVPLTVLADDHDTASTSDETTEEIVPLKEIPEADTATSTDQTVTSSDDTSTTTDDTNQNDGTDGSDGETTDSGSDGTATSSGETDMGTTTPTGGDTATGGDGTDGNLDDGAGTDGTDGNATSTDPCGEVSDCTASSTDETNENDGTQGSDGTDGSDGDSETPESATSTAPNLEEELLEVLTDDLIGDIDQAENDDITGSVEEIEDDNTEINILTGMATARGELFTNANSTKLSSIAEGSFTDLDIYNFSATGTNEAVVTNDAGAFADTGANYAETGGEATITTGNAISAFNIANVVNSSVVNSDGYMYLANQIMEENQSLDLQDFFFPDSDSLLARANTCNLLSCQAEDITYNFSQQSQATIQNDAYIEAITGDNVMRADSGEINAGNAYATANVINVVNTNIVDSNYRLLTFNAVGDLDGNLVLPTEALFEAFFGLPNGTNQLEHPEERSINVNNVNNAEVNNNLDTYAETGRNRATAPDSDIVTGDSEAESNVLNKIDTNVYGGDLMYLLIRVHGYWYGDVVGLPDGLTWEWTPDGVFIYNESAEITPSELFGYDIAQGESTELTPSEFLGYDIDSYTANFTNHNDVTINNNINIDAVTGRNTVRNQVHGDITTGDAYASANVMNIANTNVIGANWTMAIVNILGDFDGNVTFSRTDVGLSGTMTSPDDPLRPGSLLNFSYTVANTSDKVASNVVLKQALINAHTDGNAGLQSVSLGDIAPGKSTTTALTAYVKDGLETGTTVKAVANVFSAEGDANLADNTVVLTEDVVVPTIDPDPPEPDDDAATSTPEDDSSDDEEVVTNTNNNGGGDSSSGGGSSSHTKSVEREQEPADPNSAPHLVVKKTAKDHEDGDSVAAGTPVDYTIVVTNEGGNAYDAMLYDTLTNPIGAVLSEESWELGTILAGEVIEVEYTTTYNLDTPTGKYTNTASIEAYRHEDSKAEGDDPLKLDADAHVVYIVSDVALAVGNVQPLAFFPLPNGTVGALVSWETSQPATSQIFYGHKLLVPIFNTSLPNYGYQNASFRFPDAKTRHLMLLYGLSRGTTYAYHIEAATPEHQAFGGEYSFTVPALVAQLTLANQPPSMVAGAASSSPTTLPTPAPAPATTYTPPVPAPRVVTPEPEPEPEPVPVAADNPTDTSTGGGFLSGVKNKVFGFFR